jgi:hypothetical protein
MRFFSAATEPTPGKASGRMTGNPSFYNKRFESSTSLDSGGVDFQAYIRGASGSEPKQTVRDPNAFQYSNNIFKNDYWEMKMRLSDYLYQIGSRLHRSNDGWTRCLVGWTAFSFMMIPQALIWKIHFGFFSMATLSRIRDKGAEPTIDEILVLDTVFANEKLAELFTPETYHVIDFDQEWDEGTTNAYFPEYKTNSARFFNADTNSTTGMYKFGDVESGAMMTLHYKTMPYSNNKYNFTEPFLIYDMYAEVTHNGKVSTVSVLKAEEVLKTKRTFVPWH